MQVDYETEDDGKHYAIAELTAKNITDHALRHVDIGLFFRDNNSQIGFRPLTAVSGDEEIPPGAKFTANDRYNVTDIYDRIYRVDWAFYVNLSLVKSRDARPEEDRDELTPFSLAIIRKMFEVDRTDARQTYIMASGALKNVSKVEFSDLQVLYLFHDDNDELLDYVYADLTDETGGTVLAPGDNATYMFRHPVGEWINGSYTISIRVLETGAQNTIATIDRSGQ